MKKINGYSAYDKIIDDHARSDVNDMTGLGRKLQVQAEQAGLPVDSNPRRAGDAAVSDLRKNVPPQLFAVVNTMIDLIGEVEKKAEGNEGQPNQSDK